MPSEPSLPFLRVVVSGAIAMILILAVRSPDLGRMPATTTPPPETVFVPTLVERQPSPRVPGPAAPRRVRLTPPSRVPQTTVATVTPRAIASEPDLFADEPENEPLMLAALPEPAVADTPEPYKPSARGTQFYARSTFAAVPGAELTTQTR